MHRSSPRIEADPLLSFLSVSTDLHSMQLGGRGPSHLGQVRSGQVTGHHFGKKCKHGNLMLQLSASLAYVCFSIVWHWPSILSLLKPVKTSKYLYRQLRVRGSCSQAGERAASVSWYNGSSLLQPRFERASPLPLPRPRFGGLLSFLFLYSTYFWESSWGQVKYRFLV